MNFKKLIRKALNCAFETSSAGTKTDTIKNIKTPSIQRFKTTSLINGLPNSAKLISMNKTIIENTKNRKLYF